MSQIPVYLTMGLGSMVAAVGCASFVDPAKGWETFGMPSTSKESEVLAYIFGARAMMIGERLLKDALDSRVFGSAPIRRSR